MAQNKVLYTIGKGICMPIFKLFYRFKTINADNIPSEGGVIIASNHISNSDPPLLGLSAKRRMYFMAKVELFKNKFFGALIRALGAFPVERGAGDGKAIKTGEDLIKEGNVMTIFIEGVIEFGEPLTPEKLGLNVDGGRRELKDASNMIMGEIKKMRERALNEYKKG